MSDAGAEDRRRGVASVEAGALLLRALAEADGPRSLGLLARAAGMSPAKAHRYLVSFVNAGLVTQSERNGWYDVGPLAVRLGLAALERFDVVRLAAERLTELRDATQSTSMISVWTDAGPAVARIELSPHPVTLAVRLGTIFPLETTATGRIFLAFAPERAPVPPSPGLAGELERVRRSGVAAVDQTFLVGVQALALPLTAGDGRLVAALTVVGAPGALDLGEHGATVAQIRRFIGALAGP